MARLNQILKTAFLSGALALSPLANKVLAQDTSCLPIDNSFILRDYEVADSKGVRSIISMGETDTELSLPVNKNERNILIQYSNKDKIVAINIIGIVKPKEDSILKFMTISTIDKAHPDSLSSLIELTPKEIPSALEYKIKRSKFGMFEKDYNSAKSVSPRKMVECLNNYGNSVLKQSQ